jgi:hypothetical protein
MHLELLKRMSRVALLGAVLVQGCGSLDGDDADSGSSRATAPDTPAYGSVPRSAERVAQGYGTIRYRAEQAGRVWIGNDARRAVVTETRVRRGEEVVVEPREDRVSVGGQVVFDRNMERSEEHSVFMLAEGVEGGGVVGGDTYGDVPEGAQRLEDGTGRIRAKVPAAGRVWVANDTKRFVITSFDVAAGDEVEVDAGADRVLHNKREVYSQNLESKHDHVIFYRESLGSAGYGKIPSEAERVATGTGTVVFRVERDGFVWVGDDELRRELLLHPVKRGDVIEVEAKRDEVKINGKVVYNQNLESKHRHSIYFR